MAARVSVLALCVLASIITGMVVVADEDCALEGQWYDPASTRNDQLIFRFSVLPNVGLTVFAVTGNSQWSTGEVHLDSTTGHVVVFLDDGSQQIGDLDLATCAEIKWSIPAGPIWEKIPNIDQVHVIFMNHLDVGYNGIPSTGFINNVLNMYFQVYFPRAVKLAAEMKLINPTTGFIYTTHPWLIDMYLNCPPNLVLSGVKLQCPSKGDTQEFTKAIQEGHIAWHSGPMNMQVEAMNDVLLQAGLQISQDLDKEFNQKTTVLSQRDVPGMTSCVIPLLLENGIKAVTVGVNPGSAPPAVPNLFQWEYSGKRIIAMWHPGGYPLNPGDSLSNAGGLSLMDCVIAEESSQVLAFAFRTDNSGPPTSVSEIESYYNILREQFPDATVVASTLTNFVNSINGSSLPVVRGEIGDTWIQGVASDPRKMAELNAAMSGLSNCVVDNECHLSNSQVKNATRFLVKLPEHTWGLPNVGDNVNWSNSAFQKAKSRPNYINCENSWLEQREFLNLTLQASYGHPLYDYITKALAKLTPVPPSLQGYRVVNPIQTFKVLNGIVTVTFDPNRGWINEMTYDGDTQLVVLADTAHPIAVLSYHTYNESDFQHMNSLYDYYGNAGYDKPNSTINAHPNSSTTRSTLIKLYQSENNPSDFILLLHFSEDLHVNYGAPETVWLKLGFGLSKTAGIDLNLELVWLNKTATRLAEATMLSFYPLPQKKGSIWQGKIQKISNSTWINITSVLTNGSQYQHVSQKVIFREATATGALVQNGTQVILTSPDIPLICPIVSNIDTPTPFPAPLEPIESSQLKGIGFNLHNNVWNTNYPLWYPFDNDADFMAKFTVSFYTYK